MKTIYDSYPAELIKIHNKIERELHSYEEENAWWYYFFQATGSNNYDPEYADHLRIYGVPPEVAAEKASI